MKKKYFLLIVLLVLTAVIGFAALQVNSKNQSPQLEAVHGAPEGSDLSE